MATYSKETALYDTGAIADDIAGAGNTANYYLTTISGTSGISVHNKNDTSNYVNINSTDGMNVVKGGTNVAQFGTTARVGSASSSHFNMNASSLQAYDSNNNKYFEVSSSGITYGSNTVANTTDVSNAVNAVEVYSLDSSYPSVTVDTNGSHPTSLTLSSTYTKGSAAPASYAGRIKVETSTDNTNWTALYTSSSNESSKTITTPTNVEDSEPYVFRQTPSGAGNAVDDSAIVGGTVAWNQLCGLADIEVTNNGITISYSATTGETTVVVNNAPTGYCQLAFNAALSVTAGHKVLLMADKELENGLEFYSGRTQGGVRGSYPTPRNKASIIEASNNSSNAVMLYVAKTTTAGTYKHKLQYIDLTQMFGSTIADYIYSLEQSTAGAGVAYFKKLGFTKPYYEYNAGELMSVNAVGQKTVGFNQWDEEWELGSLNFNTGEKTNVSTNIRSKNYIKALPNTTYFVKMTTGTVYLFEYDADKNFIKYNQTYTVTTTSSTAYFLFVVASTYGTTYNHDICINISDPSRNGTYEPYNEHTYDLANLTLRGIPKLVNNKVTYDGDTYEADGTVTRKYGIVDLSQYQSNLVYNSGFGCWRLETSAVPKGLFKGNYSYPNMISSTGKQPEYFYGTKGDNRICIADGGLILVGNNSNTTKPTDVIVYELATPTTETAQSFTSLKSIDAYGTERYIDGLYEAGTRDVAVPVGHISKYASGVKSIRASLYKAGGTTTLLAQKIIPFTANFGGTALNDASQLESYSIDSYPSVALSIDGATPSALTLSAKRTKGSALEDYSGRIKVETSLNNSTWTTEYTSSSDESSVTYNSPANITDNAPYNFRAVPSGVGNVMRDDEIVGGTVAWNQLTEHGNFDSESGWNKQGTFTVANNIGTWVNDSTGGNLYRVASGRKNHVYFLTTSIKTPTETTDIYIRYSATSIKACSATTQWQTISTIYKRTANDVDNTSFGLLSGLMGEPVQVKNFMQIDLTQMFGSTIADYIYSLEQANAGAGVAWFKKLFPKPYYAYNAGELKSVSGLVSHDMTGFNQFDKSTAGTGYISNATGNAVETSGYVHSDYIRVVPNTSYNLTSEQTAGRWAAWYDANKNFIYGFVWNLGNTVVLSPANACYARITVKEPNSGNVDTFCFNLAWDNSRNGEYEPYELHSYPLDSTLTLRGIPKLDADNKLYYDGDTYESDGTVTRKYGIVDLGTLNWNRTTSGSIYYFYNQSGTPIPFKQQTYPTDTTLKCVQFVAKSNNNYIGVALSEDNTICYGAGVVCIRCDAYTTGDSFKSAMSGVYLVYELATPTTETADPFQNPQVVNDFGTEEYVTTGIPVGHNSTYISGVKAIRASLYKAGGTTTLLAQKIIPCGTDLGSQAIDAAQTATTYITAIDESGIKVHASNNPNSNYSKINADGMEVYKGGSSVAAFGVETRIGQRNASRVELESNRIALIAENGLSALEAVTSGKEISAIYDVYGIDARLPSNTSNNVFTIDMSGVAIDAPFYVTIVSRYVYTLTISTQYNVWSADFNKGCDSVRIGFTKKTQTESKSGTLKMVSALTAQYDPTPIVTTTDKSVTVAYNATNSTLTITTPTYPTIADSQYAYGYGTNFITRGDSYLEVSAVSASFSKYIPKTEIYGRTYLEMNTGLGLPDEIDESILTSLNALGWRQDCIE